MLTCRDFLKELNDYLDDTVDVAIRAQVEDHITRCPNCWVVFDTCKKTIQVYKGMEPQEIPAEIHDRLMDALQRRMATGRPIKNA